MSQGKKDKFLPIYFGALGLGVIVLGYLGWSASSSADEAEQAFKAKMTELETLEKAPISRTDANAKKKKELVDAYVKKVQELSKVMESYQVPINDKETTTSFQAKLAAAAKTVKEAAAARQVKISDKFDFGMGRYLAGDFSVPGAAPRLSAQLDGLVALSMAAIESGLLEIDSLTRVELPFETEKKEEPRPDAKAPKKPAGGTKPADKKAGAKEAPPTIDESKVLERQPVSITVTGKNSSVRGFLEKLANSDPATNPHFFVIRTLKVENEAKDGPSKAIQPQVTEKPDPANKDAPPIKYDAVYLLGNEKVKMQLELDLVRFVPEPPPEEKGTRSTAKTAAAPDDKEKTDPAAK